MECDADVLITLFSKSVMIVINMAFNSGQLCEGLGKRMDSADDSNPLEHSLEPVLAPDYVRV